MLSCTLQDYYSAAVTLNATVICPLKQALQANVHLTLPNPPWDAFATVSLLSLSRWQKYGLFSSCARYGMRTIEHFILLYHDITSKSVWIKFFNQATSCNNNKWLWSPFTSPKTVGWCMVTATIIWFIINVLQCSLLGWWTSAEWIGIRYKKVS